MPFPGLFHPEDPQAWVPQEPSAQWPPCQLPYFLLLDPQGHLIRSTGQVWIQRLREGKWFA